MKYSLINVTNQYGKYVDGIWIQNFIGTLEEATQYGRETEKANSNRILVAVVNELAGTTLIGAYRKHLESLDI